MRHRLYATLASAPPAEAQVQRQCACGGHAAGGHLMVNHTPCRACEEKRRLSETPPLAKRRQHHFGQVALHPPRPAAGGTVTLHRQTGGGSGGGGQTQGYTPPATCDAAAQTRTEQIATDAYNVVLPYVALAETALTRLHSAWIDHKAELLAGTKTLSGAPVCAFDSNFNITQRHEEYGVRQIRAMRRLSALNRRMSQGAGYVCLPASDPNCTSNTDGDTEAYVVNNQPPIYFCPPFSDSLEMIGQQSTVLHEYAHLLPGVGDQGGYAAFGAQSITCAAGIKFSADSADLVNTADALAGFAMHVGQENDTTVHVRERRR